MDECMWCGNPIEGWKEGECIQCWGLRSLIAVNLELTEKILKALQSAKHIKDKGGNLNESSPKHLSKAHKCTTC